MAVQTSAVSGPSQNQPRRCVLGPLLLLLAGSAVLMLGSDSRPSAGFVSGLPDANRDVQVGMAAYKIDVRKRLLYEGTTKRLYLRRLQHRRWCATFPYPRIWGFVMKWNDKTGEGIILEQEKKRNYLVIRDDISKSYHNYKTLMKFSMVEFFATDELDSKTKMLMAKNVTGMHGTYVKSSQEYIELMLRKGNFPKRWKDDPEDYKDIKKVGEYYLNPKWACGWTP
eukprot:TRINITY_DN105733_c0_g1_i1.p1 TRINITY_DN105733_c0_g1~~TRINITY_DN105733_c0_g1_i1.p1  ORF type:complete len:251 (-),score=33.10 TRINITY_DN105733_c0_g1_i1:74-748(-)